MKQFSSNKREPVLYALFLTGVVVAFLIGFFGRQIATDFGLPGGDLALLREAKAIVTRNTINTDPGETKLEYGMIRGMLQAYNDPYTSFVEPPQHELQSNQLSGSFGGIGSRLERDADGYLRLYPFINSPAAKAGIRDGDRLVRVDDLLITPETDSATLESTIRGPVGEKVRIGVTRPPDTRELTFTVTRAEVALPSTTYNLLAEEPRAGLIRTSVIAATTPDEISAAVAALKQQGATVFVLDLRDNGGGLVEAGVNSARLFLKDGEVASEQYRDRPQRTYSVEKPGALSDIPLVVLVNANTASAAEILAGALQARGRAQLVGAPTYGKNTIQLVFDLSDGSSVHVTAAHWSLPGKTVPLQPDVPKEDDGSGALALAAAKRLLGD